MRNQKTIELDTEAFGKKKITVYEVSPLTLLKTLKANLSQGIDIKTDMDFLSQCTDLTKEELGQLYPSELRSVFEAFKEVNSDFFLIWPPIQKTIQKLGLTDWAIDLIQKSGIMAPLKEEIISSFQKNLSTQLSGS